MGKRIILILGIMLATASMQLVAMESQSKIKSLLLYIMPKKTKFLEALALLEKSQLSKEDLAYIQKENSIRDAIQFLSVKELPAANVVRFISLLVKNGADINSTAQSPGFGSTTPLEYILIFNFFNFRSNIASDRIEIANTLLDFGANPVDAKGKPLLEKVPNLPEYAQFHIMLVKAMLKLTKEQKDSVYALIASLKHSPSLQTSKDTRELIAQKLINEYKKENRAKTRAEIEKIENGELKNQLLQLLERK